MEKIWDYSYVFWADSKDEAAKMVQQLRKFETINDWFWIEEGSKLNGLTGKNINIPVFCGPKVRISDLKKNEFNWTRRKTEIK